MKKSEIILQSLYRSFIKFIPVVGSPLDQITYGTVSSLEDKELIDQLKILQKEINKLDHEKLNEKEIYEKLKNTEGHINTIKKIEEKENSLKKQLAIVKADVNTNKDRIEREKLKYKKSLEKSLDDIDSSIEAIENEQDILSKSVRELYKLLTEIKGNKGDSLNLKIKSISQFKVHYKEIKESCRELGQAIKLSSKQQQLLLDPLHIFLISRFPYDSKDIDIVYLLYLVQNRACRLICLNSDKLEVAFNIKELQNNKYYSHIRAPRCYISNRFKQFASQVDFIDFEYDKELFSKHFKLLVKHYDNNGNYKGMTQVGIKRNMDTLVPEMLRFFALNSPEYQLTSTILSSEHKKKDIYSTLLNQDAISDLFEKNKIISSKTLALMAFESKKAKNRELLITVHKIFLKIKESIEKEVLEFENLQEVNKFLKELRKVKKEIVLFKEDIKTTVIDEIKNAKEQHLLFLTAFSAFHKAYSQIGKDLDDFLLSEIDFED